jgi:1,4-dihydroxy-2-naphthoyl-CoA hydrolase
MGESSGPVNPLHDLVTGLPAGELRPVPDELASVPPGCLLDTLGIRLTDVGVGRSRAEMALGPVHLNQRGLPQGGAFVVLADAAAGWASYAAVPGGRFTTLELKCNLLGRASVGDTLVAVTSPVHLGRQTLMFEVRIMAADQEGAERPRLTAAFSCTQLVLGS